MLINKSYDMKDIVMIGGGGHAKVVLTILKKLKYNIIGYTDLVNCGTVLNTPYIGKDEELFNLDRKPKLALGIGQLYKGKSRELLINKFLENDFIFETIISPDSTINIAVTIGQGTVVMDGAIIQTGTRIGDYSIINTNSSIDHDCKIGSYVHIAPGVTLCGEVSISDNCMVGTGSTIINNITISKEKFIKAGSLIY
jgi:sugar O-acyltransferase (sialic acid O-acetyltransferase NeuD family)